MTDPINRLNAALEGRYRVGPSMRGGGTPCSAVRSKETLVSWFRLLVLIVFMGSSLAGCYGRRSAQLPEPPAPIGNEVIAVILTDGEEIDLVGANVELTALELIIREPSGREDRRIPRSEIRELVVRSTGAKRVFVIAGSVVGLALLLALAALDSEGTF